ncbi:hypothetical protein GJ496_008734 [Pomphorhynchus laevis]|nr:hypothetical protein GJ496_008734 [Pomphorhynchus laevis]
MHNFTLFAIPIAFFVDIIGVALFIAGNQSNEFIVIEINDVPNHLYGLFSFCENVITNGTEFRCCGFYNMSLLEFNTLIPSHGLYFVFLATVILQLFYLSLFIGLFLTKKVGNTIWLTGHFLTNIAPAVMCVIHLAIFVSYFNSKFREYTVGQGYMQCISGAIMIVLSDLLIASLVLRLIVKRMHRKFTLKPKNDLDNFEEPRHEYWDDIFQQFSDNTDQPSLKSF